ncbi:MAG TPA: transglutaminase-like cysteine peptidase [Xanthobacteraceae bacterium]
MQVNCTWAWTSVLASATFLVVGLATPTASAASDQQFYITLGGATRPPIGWVDFCVEYAPECETKPLEARDVVLSPKAWKDLAQINKWVNESVWPITDMDHWGVVERWNYPDDGYGDCEDYVLLKRKMLLQAAWPRQALLITVVRDRNGEGHAVLTVKTDRGEFILDNQNPEILLWSETGYHFVKRQSQTDPNNWVALGDPRPAVATATSR